MESTKLMQMHRNMVDRKINVGCDFMNANTEAIKKHLAADPDINFWVMMHQVEKESQELVKHYIRLSGSEGKSL